MSLKKWISCLMAVCLCCGCGDDAPTPDKRPPGNNEPVPAEKERYRIFLGNTHAHCRYSGDAVQTDENSVENHFRLAKANGYDFYCITDHSQYESYTPQAWEHLQAAAEASTDASFVAIRGYEHSENNGPGAKGHQNVYNSSTYLDALAEGIDMPYFHNWLAEAANAGAIVSMNHPGKDQYSGFACYNEQARPHIRLIELINGTNDYYESFLAALAKGWKVSPVAGCDNHATKPIATWQPRTGIAAKKLTRESLLEAMAAGRTYATYDKNLQLLYYVDNHAMGSEIRTSANKLTFEIEVFDPDESDVSDRIVRIEIIGEDDRIVASETFSAHRVDWKVQVPRGQRYYYLKVYTASSEAPTAYAAPVWMK
ncbi:MAG: CehA/McbA family metallohydrolase [Alistipes senegalensis]|nr:CehA/McbA family metallohydrolase [Bacteroides cellulosilyticus]MCM1352514.1 CehA/McbA family metallohydrolase [Alistipes senegalensis]